MNTFVPFHKNKNEYVVLVPVYTNFFLSQQIPLNYSNNKFYPAFHHLLPPPITCLF